MDEEPGSMPKPEVYCSSAVVITVGCLNNRRESETHATMRVCKRCVYVCILSHTVFVTLSALCSGLNWDRVAAAVDQVRKPLGAGSGMFSRPMLAAYGHERSRAEFARSSHRCGKMRCPFGLCLYLKHAAIAQSHTSRSAEPSERGLLCQSRGDS